MGESAKKMKTGMRAVAGFILIVPAVLNVCGAAGAAANLGLKPGKYTVTITYQVQDQRQSQSRSSTRCVTQQDLGNPEKIFNDQVVATPKEKDACSVKDLKSADGKISYDAECVNRTVHVEGILSGTEFAVVRTVKPEASEGVSLKFTVKGTRTGDCLSIGGR